MLLIIKIKSLSIIKRTNRVIPTLVLIKIRPRSAPTADRMVTSELDALKKQEESYKGKPENLTGSKKRQSNDMKATEA